MTTGPTVGDRIAQLRRELSARERRDVLQSEIAAAIRVATATLSRWERNDRVPSEADLGKLAVFYGVTPAYLRYGITEEGAQSQQATPAPVSPKPVPEHERMFYDTGTIVAGRGAPEPQDVAVPVPEEKRRA